jgi:hypothetical protein
VSKAKVRTFSAVDRDIDMLDAIAAYHGFSKSAMIASLVRKEFWRVFPAGTPEVRPDDGAAVAASPAARVDSGSHKEKKR